VGGGPHGFADESVKLAARRAETIVERIFMLVYELNSIKSANI
jgi:hypothetical protein